MNRRLHTSLALSALLGLALLGAGGAALAQDPRTRDVSLSWDEVEGAVSYEYTFDQWGDGEWRRIAENPERVKGTAIKAHLGPGRYRLKLRALDRRGVPGGWGEGDEFKVPPQPPVTVSPKKGDRVEGDGVDKVPVSFQWRPVEGGASYEITVIGMNGAEVARQRSNEATTEVSLPVGKPYMWRVVAYTRDGDPGDASRKSGPFRVIGGALPSPAPTAPGADFAKEVIWPAVPGAESYEAQMYIRPSGDLLYKAIGKRVRVTTPRVSIPKEYPPGYYRVEVTAKSQWRRPSAVGEARWPLGDRQRGVTLDALERLTGGTGKLWVNASGQYGHMVYSFLFRETNTVTAFGTGVATSSGEAGIVLPKSRWGLSLGADVAYPSIAGERVLMYSVPALGLLRFAPRSWMVFTLGAGYSFHQWPTATNDVVTGEWVVGSVRFARPSVMLDARMAVLAGVWGHAQIRVDGQPGAFATNGTAGTSDKGSRRVMIGGDYDVSRTLQLSCDMIYASRAAVWQAQTATDSTGSLAAQGDLEVLSISTTGVSVGLEYNFW